MNDRDRTDMLTEHARKVLALAQEEAQRFNHNYTGTEHLLLGLIREGEGVGAQVLISLGVDLAKIRSSVEFIISRGDRIVLGPIGLTPRGKRVIELAVDEARRLHHAYIGTEHLLLGLVREGDGIAAGVLESLGVSLERVRARTTEVLAQVNRTPLAQLKDAASIMAVMRLNDDLAVPLQEALQTLVALLHEKEAAVLREEYMLAAELRAREVTLRQQIAQLEAEGQQDAGDGQTARDDEG